MQAMHRKFRPVLLLTVLWALLLPSVACAAPSDYDRNNPGSLSADQLYGESAIVMDVSDGSILFDKSGGQRMYPASTTKMMTLLLACEVGWDFNMDITIPAEAGDIASDSSLIPVYPGEVMKYGDLLYGMMLHSGNDGANAIAVLVGGSIPNFVQMMNDRAAELGCTNTHFANAHGYHDENHYTTAEDLAKIACAALKNEDFRTIVRTYKRDIVIISNGSVREITLLNKDVMLNPNSDYYLEGCIGIKTGSHNAAGQCLVGAVDRDDIMLVTVTLKCAEETEKWVDTTRLTRFGYTRYTSYPLEQLFEMVKPRIAPTKAANAKKSDPNKGEIDFKLAQISDASYTRKIQTGSATALSNALESFANSIEIRLYDDLVAPITQGQAVGTLIYTKLNGETITATLISANDIAAQPDYPAIFDLLPFLHIFENKLVCLLLLLIALLVVVVILAKRSGRSHRQRRRAQLVARRKKEYARRDREAMARKKRKPAPSGAKKRTTSAAAPARRPSGAAPSASRPATPRPAGTRPPVKRIPLDSANTRPAVKKPASPPPARKRPRPKTDDLDIFD